MLITLNEVQNIYEVFSKFADQHLPLKTSYKIMKLLRALDNELEFYRNQLRSIIQDCAEVDSEGNIKYTEDRESVWLKKDKIEEYNTRYAELIGMEIEFGDEHVFTFDELEQLELTPKDLAQIDNLIQE